MKKIDYINENILLLEDLARYVRSINSEEISQDYITKLDGQSLSDLIKKWEKEINSVNKSTKRSGIINIINFLFNLLLRHKNKNILGKKNFDNLIKNYENGGAEAVDRIIAKVAKDRILLADAFSALSRHLAYNDPQQASEYAYQAWKYDPKPYRLKWFAFKLNAASRLKDSLAILMLLKDQINFSNSEERTFTSLQDKCLKAEKSINTAKQNFSLALSSVEVSFDIPKNDRSCSFYLVTLKLNGEINKSSTLVKYEYDKASNSLENSEKIYGAIFLNSTDQTHFTKRILIKNCCKYITKINITFMPENTDHTLTIIDKKIEFIDNIPTNTYPCSLDNLCEVFEVEEYAQYLLKTDIFYENNPNGILIIEYYDSHLNMALPSNDYSINPDFGNYVYLIHQGKEKNSFKVPTYKNVGYIKISGKQLSNDDRIILKSRPNLLHEKNSFKEIEKLKNILNNLNQKDNVILLYASTASIGYEKPIKLRSARLAHFFSENSWIVIYCTFDNPSKIIINDYLFQVGPEYKGEIINCISNRYGDNNLLYISSFTDVNSVGVINRMRNMGWRVIFELRDDMEEMWSLGISKWYNPVIEKYIVSNADKLVAVSWRLKNRLEAMSGRQDVILSPNGVSEKFVDACAFLRTETASAKRSKFRIVGYIGSLNHNFFDWAILKNFSLRNPKISIEIIGNNWPKNFELPKNIIYMGEIYHDESLDIVSRWSAGLIPFIPSRLTWAVSPNKAYEYLAMGLRIISAPMGRINELPLVRTFVNLESFERCVLESFEPIKQIEYNIVNNFLRTDNWGKRFRKLFHDLEIEK